MGYLNKNSGTHNWVTIGLNLSTLETGTFRNPLSRLTSFDLDLTRPEYTCPSGNLGVRAGVCIWQNTVVEV